MTITSQTGNNNGIYGAYMVVVYQDPATTVKKIWINDECDMLYAGTARSVTNEEATTYANFAGVDTTGVTSGKAIAILSSANEAGTSKFFFKNNEYAGFGADYQSGPQIGFSVYDVTSALTNGANEARLQSFIMSGSGDNMVAQNVILIVEKSTPAAPVAAFSGTPTSGPKPLTVTFTDSSSGSITSRLWEYKLNASSTWTTFTLDGASKYSFANTGVYDVRLNVTGRAVPTRRLNGNTSR